MAATKKKKTIAWAERDKKTGKIDLGGGIYKTRKSCLLWAFSKNEPVKVEIKEV